MDAEATTLVDTGAAPAHRLTGPHGAGPVSGAQVTGPASDRPVFVAGGLAVLAVAGELGGGALVRLAVARGAPLDGWTQLVLQFTAVLTLAVLGVLVVARTARNRIGWMLLALASSLALSDAMAGYAALSLLTAGGPPGGGWAGALQPGYVVLFALLTFLALLVPDGRLLPGPRWRIVAYAAALVFLANYVVLVGSPTPPPPPFDGVRNPLAVPWLATAGGVALTVLLWVLMLAALICGPVAIAVRLRRARGVQRQQLKWIASGAVLVPVTLAGCGITVMLGFEGAFIGFAYYTLIVAIPATTAVAILRYRLYDIDRIINRTLVYGLLTVVLAAAYGVAVMLAGRVSGGSSVWMVAAATLVAAVAFRPARAWAQQVIDRRFSRRRYEAARVMDAFVARLREGSAGAGELPAALAQALGDPTVEVLFRLPDGSGWVTPAGHAADVPTDGAGGAVTELRGPDGAVAVLVHDPALREEPWLVETVAVTGRLAVEIARLQAALQHQLAEVRASRTRIVAAADAERRRIGRNLHDGAQQRLVALGMSLRVAQQRLSSTAPEAVDVLDAAVAEVRGSVLDLRELARGLDPPGLAEGGLPGAVRELAGRFTMPVRVDLPPGRLPGGVEAAAYFVAAEAVTNAVKHAGGSRIVVTGDRVDDRFRLRVVDDGVGGARIEPGGGLAGLADRLDALGGSLTVASPPGRGTTVTAELPCGS